MIGATLLLWLYKQEVQVPGVSRLRDLFLCLRHCLYSGRAHRRLLQVLLVLPTVVVGGELVTYGGAEQP